MLTTCGHQLQTRHSLVSSLRPCPFLPAPSLSSLFLRLPDFHTFPHQPRLDNVDYATCGPWSTWVSYFDFMDPYGARMAPIFVVPCNVRPRVLGNVKLPWMGKLTMFTLLLVRTACRAAGLVLWDAPCPIRQFLLAFAEAVMLPFRIVFPFFFAHKSP